MVVAATGGHRHHCVNQRNHRSTHYGVVFVLELHIQRVSFSPCIFISIHKSDAIEGRCGTESVAVILDIISFWEFAWMNYVCLMAFLYPSFTVEQPRGAFSWRLFPVDFSYQSISNQISHQQMLLLCFVTEFWGKKFTSVGYHGHNNNGFLGSRCRLGAGTVRPTTSADSWHLIWFLSFTVNSGCVTHSVFC